MALRCRAIWRWASRGVGAEFEVGQPGEALGAGHVFDGGEGDMELVG
jgi:hypothetical protein